MLKGRWIQRAIKRPGALKRWLKRGGSRIVVGATKKPVWTRDGEINTNTLKSFRRTEAYKKLPPSIKRRINLAITLERLAGKRRR
ncbi:MAG: capsid protein VP2 [Candidatus Bathyarchaeia archaeon]